MSANRFELCCLALSAVAAVCITVYAGLALYVLVFGGVA